MTVKDLPAGTGIALSPSRNPDDPSYTTGTIRVAGTDLASPLYYHDTAAFGAVLPASYGAVAALLPSSAIHPARWVDGSALVVVSGLRHAGVAARTRAGEVFRMLPRGEVLVGVMVGFRRPSRFRPFGAMGAFVLALPSTDAVAADSARDNWGYPSFVADIDFDEQDRSRSVVVGEAGADVLSLRVTPRGPAVPDRSVFMTYTVRSGRLVLTPRPMRGYRQLRPGGAQLTLGNHPIADVLRSLKVKTNAALTASYLTQRAIVPEGRTIAPASEWHGHRGLDNTRRLGRYTVTYPKIGALDQYTDLRLSAG